MVDGEAEAHGDWVAVAEAGGACGNGGWRRTARRRRFRRPSLSSGGGARRLRLRVFLPRSPLSAPGFGGSRPLGPGVKWKYYVIQLDIEHGPIENRGPRWLFLFERPNGGPDPYLPVAVTTVAQLPVGNQTIPTGARLAIALGDEPRQPSPEGAEN